MFARLNEGLKRMVVGTLGATLFGATCLFAAIAPAEVHAAPAPLSQPAPTPSS